MKEWMIRNLFEIAKDQSQCPEWLSLRVFDFYPIVYWKKDVEKALRLIVEEEISWPWFKPQAILNIDSRSFAFNGTWPTLDFISQFQSWNKR